MSSSDNKKSNVHYLHDANSDKPILEEVRGMRPDGWREVRLGDVILFNPRESIAKNQIAKKIAMEKLKPFNKFINDYELAEYKGGTKFRNGDTLLARITPCLENGKTSQVTILNDDEVGFGSTEYIVLREQKNVTNKDFIFYMSISPKFRDIAIQSMVGSSGRQRVQQDVLENSEVLLPPFSEQNVIAATLSCLDDKIELNNRINKTLEEMAQAIFKSWFVDFEPFQDGEFEDSELGRIPKGWRVGNLGEIADSQKTVRRRKEIEPGSRYVGLEHIPRHELIISESGTIEDVSSDKLSFCKKHILFGKIRPYFHKVSIAPWNGYCSTDTIVLEPKDPDIYAFFSLTVFSKEFVKYAVGISQGTKMPRAEWNALRMYRLVIPPNNIALKFNIVISPIIDQMILHNKENKKLSHIRDSLLPKLMSGEIRVPIEEGAIDGKK